MTNEHHHRALLRRLSAAFSVVFGLVLVASSRLLPLFDASPRLVPDANSPLLRWDIFHFLHIARDGYVYEHEWAFLPAAPWIIRYSLAFLHWATKGVASSHFILAVAMSALASETVQTLYSLSLHHFNSPHVALLASLLALLPSSPATLLFVPYNEPFFTYLSYQGMLACARNQWTRASLFFTFATAFRSNGVLLSGFIIWGLIVQPFLLHQKLKITSYIKAFLLVALVISPFITFQTIAYTIFCSDSSSPDVKWCSKFPPSIYTHVQSTYWNVGFLRYWTLSQLPNFLIACPPFLPIFAFALDHFRSLPSGLLRRTKGPNNHHPAVGRIFSLTPHVIHAVIFSCILLFASHTQIVLRLAASMPFTYWAAAWLYIKHPSYGTAWVTWSVVWGLISLILWSTFLPPA